MSNAPMQGQNVTEYAKSIVDQDPKAALDLVLAETERVKQEAERDKQDLLVMANVEFTTNGLRPKDMAGVWRMARMYAASRLVPEHFQGKVADCAIAIQMALRCKVDPMAFLQKCYIVYGRPSIETTLAVAMANTSGVLQSRITYKLSGEGATRRCEAIATLKDTGEVITSEVTVSIAHAMGWWGKKDSLWPKMTDLMLQYRSAMWLIRAYMPEVLMGIYSIDEERDSGGDNSLADAGAMFGYVPEDLPAATTTAPVANKADALADKLAGKAAEKTATPAATTPKTPAKTPPKTTPKKPAEKPKEPEQDPAPVWTPPADEDAVEEPEELQPAQEVVEEPVTPAKPKMSREETIEYQTNLLSEWMKKLRAATDEETIDADHHFEIEARAEEFAPEQLEWAKKEVSKAKAKLIKDEKARNADASKKPANQQQHMLGD